MIIPPADKLNSFKHIFETYKRINKGEIRTTEASKKGIIQAFMVTITKLLFL